MEDIFEELAARISDPEDIEESRPQPRDNEAEEVNDDGSNRRVVKAPKRIVSRPRSKLDPARLLGPRGIFVLASTFDGVKFKGKGHELDDLNKVLSKLQHWAHRLFPKMKFQDCIEKIEDLGSKKEIQTNMHKIRNGMIDLPGASQENINDDDDLRMPSPTPMADDPFDQLVSVAAPTTRQASLTEEQKARMMRNRLLAEERRQARRLAREKELETQRHSIGHQSLIDSDVAAQPSQQPSNLDNSSSPDRTAPDHPLEQQVGGVATLPPAPAKSDAGFDKLFNSTRHDEEANHAPISASPVVDASDSTPDILAAGPSDNLQSIKNRME